MLKKKSLKIAVSLVLCLTVVMASFSMCFAAGGLLLEDAASVFVTVLSSLGLKYALDNTSPSSALGVFADKLGTWLEFSGKVADDLLDPVKGISYAGGKTTVAASTGSYLIEFYSWLKGGQNGTVNIYNSTGVPGSLYNTIPRGTPAAPVFNFAIPSGGIYLFSYYEKYGAYDNVKHYYLRPDSYDVSNVCCIDGGNSFYFARKQVGWTGSSDRITIGYVGYDYKTNSEISGLSSFMASQASANQYCKGFTWSGAVPVYQYPYLATSVPDVGIAGNIDIDTRDFIDAGVSSVTIPTDVSTDLQQTAEGALTNTYDPYITLGYETAGTVTGDGVETGTGPFGNIGQWILNIPILGDILAILKAIWNWLSNLLTNLVGVISGGISNWYNNSPLKISIDNILNTLGGFNLGSYLSSILAFISGYTLFHGLLTGYLPASVATVLWSAWLVLICFWIIRFCIDR